MRRLFTLGSYLVGAALACAASGALTRLEAGQAADLIKKGQQIYDAQKCSVCHAIAGKGNKANPLDGVGAKLSAADTHAWIVDPAGMTKKSSSTKKPPMPAKW